MYFSGSRSRSNKSSRALQCLRRERRPPWRHSEGAGGGQPAPKGKVWNWLEWTTSLDMRDLTKVDLQMNTWVRCGFCGLTNQHRQ